LSLSPCRAWKSKLFAKYPFFFGYISLVLCSESVRFFLLVVASKKTYGIGFWITESSARLAVLLLTWEVYVQILAPYQGLRRMTKAVVSLVLALVVAKALVELGGSPLRNLGPTTVELERNLRAVQALLLLAIVGIVMHYAVPMGRNVQSIADGLWILYWMSCDCA